MAVDLQEEQQYLKGLAGELEKAADKLLGKTGYYSDRYLETARYIWEDQSAFDGYEKLFNQQLLNQVVDAGEQTAEQLRRIMKMLDSPYFARIDFRMQDEAEAMKVYIGKFSFWDVRSPYEVFDWRAPISSMYYEFEDGEAWYDAPQGRVSGVVDCKRQYRISRGVLEYALESSVSIDDEILQKELAKHSGHKMKDIVSTIQKEQNRLIRNESAECLIIQGVAGSGKTSIALHRVAYFLYRYRKEISAENFLIISPNGIFVDYISDVLPELGEENIRNVGMEDIAAKYLPGELRAERLAGQPERFLAYADEAWRERNAFKATEEFVRRLDEYLAHCDECNFRATDYSYEKGVLEAEFIEKRYGKLKNLPVWRRFNELAGDMAEELKVQRSAKGWGTHKQEILEWLMSQYRHNNTLELYENFYRYVGREEMFVWNGEVESADIFPMIYVRLYLEGALSAKGKDELVKYLIVDEMQDYTPIQYAVLNKLYPCRKTLLGDFSQNVVPFVQGSLDDLRRLYPGAQVIEIYKSYRSTCEIMEFAKKIGKNIVLEPVLRHGEAPRVVECASDEEERERILEIVRGWLGGVREAEKVSDGQVESGEMPDGRGESAKAPSARIDGKLGILCKSYVQAEELYLWLEGQLGMQPGLHLLTYDSAEFYDGVMVTAVSMAKGLEFDQVVLPDVSGWNYRSEYDRGLLYVACTRAMHGLTLLYSGEVSSFVP